MAGGMGTDETITDHLLSFFRTPQRMPTENVTTVPEQGAAQHQTAASSPQQPSGRYCCFSWSPA
jgi:hypothetical protein